MKQIEIIEKVLAKEITFAEANVNDTFFMAYKHSKHNKQELLNFDSVIWNYDIEPIIATCKEYGIKEITISSTFSGIIETLDIMEEHGCKIVCLTKVNNISWHDEVTKIPALKIRMPR